MVEPAQSRSFLGKRQSDATLKLSEMTFCLSSIIGTLSGARLVCHCKTTQSCHADVLISLFRQTFPTAHDRDQERQPPPTASVLDFLAKLRNEPEEDEGSSADEGVPPKERAGEGRSADDDRIWLCHKRTVRRPVVGIAWTLADPRQSISGEPSVEESLKAYHGFCSNSWNDRAADEVGSRPS